MAQIVGAFLGAEGLEEDADAIAQRGDLALGCFAEQRLEFGKEQFKSG